MKSKDYLIRSNLDKSDPFDQLKNENIDSGEVLKTSNQLEDSTWIGTVIKVSGINLFKFDPATSVLFVHNTSLIHNKVPKVFHQIDYRYLKVDNFPSCILTHRYIPKGYLTNFKRYLHTVVHGEEEVTVMALPLIAVDNSLVWIKICCVRQKDDSGRPSSIIGSYTDITDMKNRELEYQQNSQVFELLKSMSLVHFKINLVTDKIQYDCRAKEWFARETDNLTSFDSLRSAVAEKYIPLRYRQDFLEFTAPAHLMALYASNKIIESFDYLRLFEGTYRWFRMMIYIYKLSDDGIYCYLFVSDIHQQKEEELKLTIMAETDALTGLYNRSYGVSLISEYMTEHPRESGALILFDIDNFKKINDVFGHPYGDTILMTTAQKFKKCFSADDIICRIGGDEFIVFSKNTSEKECRKKLEQVVSDMSVTYSTHATSVFLSVSGGYVMFPAQGKTFEDLYNKADIAMFAAKMNGKNIFEKYDSTMKQIRKELADIDN